MYYDACGRCGAKLPPEATACPQCGEDPFPGGFAVQDEPVQRTAPVPQGDAREGNASAATEAGHEGSPPALAHHGHDAAELDAGHAEAPAETELELLRRDLVGEEKVAGRGAGAKAFVFIGTLALFALAQATGAAAPAKIAIIVGILLVHELGHLAGMWLFKYRNLSIFFIPFFGAAAAGSKRAGPAWQEAIVLLLGPLPGTLMGLAVAVLDVLGVSRSTLLDEMATTSIYINAFNLLPVLPLDGGRLLRLMLTSRHWVADAVFGVLTILALAALGLGGGVTVLLVLAVFIARGLPQEVRLARAADAMRRMAPGLPHDPAQVGERDLRLLHEQARAVVPSSSMDRRSPDAARVRRAKAMRDLHERVVRRAPGLLATGGLLCCWAGGFVASTAGLIGLWMATPIRAAPHWDRFLSPDGSFAVRFDGSNVEKSEEHLDERTCRRFVHRSAFSRRIMMIEYDDAPEPVSAAATTDDKRKQIARRIGGYLASSVTATVRPVMLGSIPGLEASPVSIAALLQVRVRAYYAGGRLYRVVFSEITAPGNLDEPTAAAFLDSFEVLSPPSEGDLAQGYCDRGSARRNKGDIDGAIADYTRAIELNPRYARPWLSRGLARAGADSRGAIQDLERFLELSPDGAKAPLARSKLKELQERR